MRAFFAHSTGTKELHDAETIGEDFFGGERALARGAVQRGDAFLKTVEAIGVGIVMRQQTLHFAAQFRVAGAFSGSRKSGGTPARAAMPPGRTAAPGLSGLPRSRTRTTGASTGTTVKARPAAGN